MAAPSPFPAPSSGRPPPNVVFIIADDHRHDALGVCGHPAVRTPHLDALARRGTHFARTYQMGGLIAAVCSPARAALLTGCNVIRADAAPSPSSQPDRLVALAPDLTTLPERFRAAGYETFITGKWHNDPAALQRSFTGGRRIFFGGMSDHHHVPLRDYSPTGDYSAPPYYEAGFSTELFCRAAEEFIQQPRGPFFLYLALTSPHDPRTPPPEFATLYPPADIPLPANFLPDHPFDNGEIAIRDERLADHPLQPDVLRAHLAAYYGMISHHDAQLSRVFTALREAGLESNTLVVYVSDHGLSLGSHGLLGKQNLYEESVRVPLLLAGPGVTAGRTETAPVYSLDLFSTLPALAGLPAAPAHDSRPLPLTASTPDGRRHFVFALYKDCQRMVSDGRWKLIRYYVHGQERRQLFDLDNDPAELTDLSTVAAHQPVIHRLLARLNAWQSSIGDRWLPPALLPGDVDSDLVA
ncbi:sulfatase-like hydrolase/transferase [Horticoccus luteus]|uniref:Sulfatase-like hydrolase/transferase n=1 Tax=Horticoccus luteus TaxID=2862869 RepID=A0A8F9TV92_9BACT|nr:sulfatase-like hydrolase/transferase [Horticoccus luteus]QYM78621.1 sulfatase-like hydrolase/transferase [Horticoccus luteus]